MNAFASAKLVEAKSRVILEPFLKERAHDGQLVFTNKGPLAQALQAEYGDVLFNSDADTIWSVELKAEEKFTGNLFLEVWSNRNLESRRSYAERGSKVGWLYSTRADYLFYHFLDRDELYIFNLHRLKVWCFVQMGEHALGPGRLWEWPEKPQSRYEQFNDTRGRIVPIAVLMHDIAGKMLRPKQIELFPQPLTDAVA